MWNTEEQGHSSGDFTGVSGADSYDKKSGHSQLGLLTVAQ